MDKLTFNVTLHEGSAEGSRMRYEPGSTVSGLVQIIPNEDINARRAGAWIRWRTEGQGDSDSGGPGQTAEIWQGDLQKGQPVQGQFSFQLPQQPWSYRGHYISIVWEVFVFVNIPFGRDLEFTMPFVMRPRRRK